MKDSLKLLQGLKGLASEQQRCTESEVLKDKCDSFSIQKFQWFLSLWLNLPFKFFCSIRSLEKRTSQHRVASASFLKNSTRSHEHIYYSFILILTYKEEMLDKLIHYFFCIHFQSLRKSKPKVEIGA